jgi:hypothetical protein
MSRLEDEAAINAAWAVLKAHGLPDGLLGAFYLESRETFVLHYEEEGSGYTEWVRLPIPDLDHLEPEVLVEAAGRLVQRISITRERFKGDGSGTPS